MNPIDLVLDRLDAVRASGARRWSARCPSHDDRTPSLAIAEGDSGAVLLHCFAGCTLEAITSALDLNLTELFPVDIVSAREKEFDRINRNLRQQRRRGSALVNALELDLILVKVFLSDLAAGRPLSAADLAASDAAASRLAEAIADGRYVA